jgi:hydrogenase maturation protease
MAKRDAAGEKAPALLVIGYGNELRSDDAVGPKTAEAVEGWQLPGIRSLACHQLTPELTVPISAAQCVVFVDATVDATDTVAMRPLAPAGPDQVMTHAADPRLLLRMAKDLFNRCPPAFLLTIPIENLALGEGLSTSAREGIQSALNLIRSLVPTPNFETQKVNS